MSNMENLYTLARRALENHDYEQSAKTFEQIMHEDPHSWEATFYYYISYSMLAVMNGDISKAINLIGNCINPVYDLIENEKDLDEQKVYIEDSNNDLDKIITKLSAAARDEYFRDTKGVDLSSDYCSSVSKLAESRKRAIKDITKLFNERKERLVTVVAKRRFEIFWANNQSLKSELESEKRNLDNEILTLEKSISEIPAKDIDYNKLTELQNLLEAQKAEKKAFGLFKFKEKKAVKEKMKDTSNQIKPIQARIDSAIQEVRGSIEVKKKRIIEIEQEFTRPR